jgi:predicted TIM-barrel fold metal-dependent hydrolase
MITDTHVHVVARDEARYPLRPSGIGSQWFREHPVSAEEYLLIATAAGVDRAVLVHRRSDRSRSGRLVARTGRSAGVRGRASLRHRCHRADLVRR